MKLYSYYRSSTSYRVRIALNLKRLDYEIQPINLKTGEQREADFAALNAYQTLPVLMTGGQQLAQSLAILDWLEQTYPSPSFLPGDAGSAQLCRELYYAIATEIHAPNNLPILKYLRSEFEADQEALEKWNARWIHRTFEPVERRLETHSWAKDDLLFGKPGLLEIVLIPQIYNARRWNVDLSTFPNLLKIDAHCAALEAFKAAHPDAQPDAPKDNS
ncbi:MAG: maleylacetoacetate isomerase [Pseudomonadota bacterium]